MTTAFKNIICVLLFTSLFIEVHSYIRHLKKSRRDGHTLSLIESAPVPKSDRTLLETEGAPNLNLLRSMSSRSMYKGSKEANNTSASWTIYGRVSYSKWDHPYP